MGDMADDLRHQEIRQEFKNYNKPKWRTKEGKVIYIEDMETNHIQNAINQYVKQGKEIYTPLQEELNRRNYNARRIT